MPNKVHLSNDLICTKFAFKSIKIDRVPNVNITWTKCFREKSLVLWFSSFNKKIQLTRFKDAGNCSFASRPMWKPNWCQVLGGIFLWFVCVCVSFHTFNLITKIKLNCAIGNLGWAFHRCSRHLLWQFRIAIGTHQRVLQWGEWWQICTTCGIGRFGARHNGLGAIGSLRSIVSTG